ncbi:hypothetical protein ALQ01_03932 [Pseudomonas savastanoi pv. glycinea]|nr:hypothetical protein ALQ01_03932 [Pseudomonas savastanoi pv. glycinea]
MNKAFFCARDSVLTLYRPHDRLPEFGCCFRPSRD